MKRMRILVVDDQRLICDGIRIILNSQPDMEVVAIADNGQSAVNFVAMHQPDIVLMDIQMPGISGIEALKEIKALFPETIVIMLTTFDPDEYILGAFRNGADGYLLKDFSSDALISSVRSACHGNITMPAAIAARTTKRIPFDTNSDSNEQKQKILVRFSPCPAENNRNPPILELG